MSARTPETFYRIHWAGTKRFCRDNAWSRQWGIEEGEEGDEPLRGYSCLDSPVSLEEYMQERGADYGSADRLIIFLGHEVGSGHDLEPLVLPKRGRAVRAQGPATALPKVAAAWDAAWDQAESAGWGIEAVAEAADLAAVRTLRAFARNRRHR